MKRTLVLLVAVFCLIVNVAPAQDPAPTSSTATVYFYRLRQYYGAILKPSIFVDKAQVVRMRNGRFAELTFPAGEHTITSTFTGNGLTVTLKPGESYYIRLNMTHATMMHAARGEVTLVAPEQGKFEVTQLKGAEPDDLKPDGEVQKN